MLCLAGFAGCGASPRRTGQLCWFVPGCEPAPRALPQAGCEGRGGSAAGELLELGSKLSQSEQARRAAGAF